MAREVAIKLVTTASTDESSLRRFEQEARATCAATHPNILAIYDVGVHDGRVYLVEELVEGVTLREALRNGALPVRRAAGIGQAVALGLAAAHAKGIVHRDIKPENVMLTRDGRVKILDFGLAKFHRDETAPSDDASTQTHATGPGTVLGTVSYMSPEQVRGLALDHRSDVFSLGVVLYEMLGGNRPFGGETVPDTQAAILNSDPPDFPPTLTITPAIDRVVRRCLEKEPELRFQSASDLAFALDALLSSAAATSGATGTTRDATGSDIQIFWRLLRRRPVFASAMILAVSLLGWAATSRPVTSSARLASNTSDGDPASSLRHDYQIAQLTTSGDVLRPAVSPDGKMVAYVRQNGREQSLWIQQVASGSAVQIVRSERGQEILGVTVSPDGSSVDFVRSQGRSQTLFRVPLLGGTPRQILADVNSATAWSPDGSHFAFVRTRNSDGVSELLVAEPSGQKVVSAFTGQQPLLLRSFSNIGSPPVRPAWSPDGRRLAAHAVESGQARLLLTDSDGRNAQVAKVAIGLGQDGLAWPTSGVLLLVTTPGSGGVQHQIVQLTQPRLEPSRLTNDLGFYAGLSTTADGKQAVSAMVDRKAGVWVGDPNGQAFVQAVKPVAFTSDPGIFRIAWAGDDLLFSSTAGGSMSQWRAQRAEHTSERLSSGRYLSASADGQRLYMVGVDRPETNVGLWRLNADGSSPARLESGSALWPRPTRDGKTIFFSSPRSGTQAVWSVDADGGEAHQLVNRFAGAVDISSDDRRVMFRSISAKSSSVSTLVACDLPACTNMIEVDEDALSYRWTPDGRDIAFVDRAAPFNITVRSVDGSMKRQLTNFPSDAEITDFAWSTDGKRLAVARVFTSSDVVMLTGLTR